MIIGFDGSRAFASWRTGTENYSYQLLLHLSKIDKKNQYIVYIHNLSLVTCHLSQNFRFKEISWPRLWTQGGLALQTLKDNLDVLFVPAHTLPIIRKPGLKTIVTVHDLGSEYLPQMHQIKQRLYLSFMQRMQLKGATKIIAVSKATKDDLVKKIGLDPQKIEVIYEGFNNKLFKPITYTLNPNPYFLFVGTVQPRKNLTRVIVAFNRVILNEAQRNEGSLARLAESAKRANARRIWDKPRDSSPARPDQNDKLELVIAGKKGWLSDEIYTLPKKLGIEERVKFLGYVPDEKLPELYSRAIALVFPSLFEGFGLPILEAQACGCPVITSNISSMPEVAGKGALLVNPYDVDDIVKGMERLQVTGYRVQLIKAGLENIKRFSWEECARETLKVLMSS